MYLEAIPLADVVAEVGQDLIDLDVAEEAQDLDEAIDVLSRVLEATIGKLLVHSAEKPNDDKTGAWPPIQLTHVAGMVMAVQHTHAILGTTEAMLQEWLRCFSSLLLSPQRHNVPDGSSFMAPYTHVGDTDMIHQHHKLLTCDMVTLYFQMHTVWSLLAKESTFLEEKDPDEEVRLKISWDSSSVGLDKSTGVLSVIGRGQGRPTQWTEDEAMAFLEDYGSYIKIEGAFMACAARRFERALSFILHKLAPQQEGFEQKGKEAMRTLQQHLSSLSKPSSAGAASTVNTNELLDSWSVFVKSLQETDYPISLITFLLPKLLTVGPGVTHIFPRICSAFYPGLRPWIVEQTLVNHKAPHVKMDDVKKACEGTESKQEEEEKKEKNHHMWRSYVDLLGDKAAHSVIFTSDAADKEEENPRLVSSLDSSGSIEQGEITVAILRGNLCKHIKRLRRLVYARDLMGEVQSHVLGTEGRRRKVLPANVLGTAICELSVPGDGKGSDANEDEDDNGMGKSEPCLSARDGRPKGQEREKNAARMDHDPVQGGGGLGILWDQGTSCGMCNLACTSSSARIAAATAGGGGRQDLGEDYFAEPHQQSSGAEDDVNDGTVIIFSCGHSYHKHCLPEKACILCLRQNFVKF